MATKKKNVLGRFIVSDPKICHGKPTFIGTRIMVWQVLDYVAKGWSWDAIMAQWPGSITEDAIAEAVGIAQRAFEDHADEYSVEPLSA